MRTRMLFHGANRQLTNHPMMDLRTCAPKHRSRGPKYFAISENRANNNNLYQNISDEDPKLQLEPGHILKVLGSRFKAHKVIAYCERDIKGWIFGKLKALPKEMELPHEHRKLLKIKQIDSRVFLGPVHMNQVKQGSIGSCYLVASILAIAHQDPKFIEQMITESNTKGLYIIQLFDHDSGKVDQIDVDLFLPSIKHRPAYGHGVFPIPQSSHQGPLWLSLIEKAYARKLGSYKKMDRGGFSAHALKILTGQQAHLARFSFIDKQKNKHTISLMKRALALGKPVVLESLPNLSKSEGQPSILSNHAYTLVHVDINQAIVADPLNPQERRIKLALNQLHELFYTAVLGRWEI